MSSSQVSLFKPFIKSLYSIESAYICFLWSLDSFILHSPRKNRAHDEPYANMECLEKDRASSQSHGTPSTARESGAGAAPVRTTIDPRQLLDPRSAQSKTSPSTPRSIVSAKSSAPASNVTNDSEMSILSDSGDHQAAANQKHAASAGTQSGMIEDMYGVEQRRHHPPKRIKVEGRQPNNVSSEDTERFRQGAGSFLGEYMEEDTDTSAPVPQKTQTPAADTIDLTLG